ncbi:hypothetical protein LT493_13520 [Streptomyces tricolor]|nr:hypothetical protein [Streptomyces tricolor]
MRERQIGDGLVVALLGTVLAAGWFTDYIGIYSVFGGFVCGVALPRVPRLRPAAERTPDAGRTVPVPAGVLRLLGPQHRPHGRHEQHLRLDARRPVRGRLRLQVPCPRWPSCAPSDGAGASRWRWAG